MKTLRIHTNGESYWRVTIPAGRLGIFRLYMTRNIRMKMTQPRDNAGKAALLELRDELRRERGCRCEMCGRPFDGFRGEMHHVLPVQHFPHLVAERRNVLLLCGSCHREIHGNPFLNGRMQLDKAAELDVDVRAAYGNPPYAAVHKSQKSNF